MKKQRFLRRALAIAVLATLASANAFGLSDKYYKTNLSVSPTGAGTVYTSVNYTKPAESDFAATSTTNAVKDSVSYAFARPVTGKGFLNWTQNGTVYSTANPVMIVNPSTTGTQTNPATISLVANFVDAAVAVISDNEVFGTVSIDNVANELGGSVQLTATPSTNTFKASDFEGWYLNGVKVSEDNPYEISQITSSNSGIYTAKFTRRAGYFRVKSQYTGKYAYMAGNQATAATREGDGFVGVKFNGSILLKPATQLDYTDPGYIVKIDGITDGYSGGLKDLDVTCQGVGYKEMINQQYPNADIDAQKEGDYWTFFYDYNGNRYFKDGTNYGYNYAIACGGASDHLWTLEPVSQIPITPVIEDGFSYATSMYTSFPYECGTGVSAWYSTGIEDDLIEVEDGHVPANTAVILRCDGEEGDFYIKPSFEEYDALEDNILEGYICLNGDSLSSAGKLVYAGGETWSSYDGAYLPSNRAFVTVSQNARPFNNTTAIKNLRSNNINNREVFDISGRKLNVDSGALRKGVYIVNGKKRVIK